MNKRHVITIGQSHRKRRNTRVYSYWNRQCEKEEAREMWRERRERVRAS